MAFLSEINRARHLAGMQPLSEEQGKQLLAEAKAKAPKASSLKGLGHFRDEKFIGEVAFGKNDGLVDDELTHVSFYQATYGKSKIIVGYEQDWGDTEDDESWHFLGSLDSQGQAFKHGDWYGSKETLEEAGKALKKPKLAWTESGMQSDNYITLTLPEAGWF